MSFSLNLMKHLGVLIDILREKGGLAWVFSGWSGFWELKRWFDELIDCTEFLGLIDWFIVELSDFFIFCGGGGKFVWFDIWWWLKRVDRRLFGFDFDVNDESLFGVIDTSIFLWNKVKTHW